MRALVILLLLVGTARADNLAAHLDSRARDRAVRKDVMRWHRTMTNGCVAFASTALRHTGVAIDERGKLDGDGISRLTRGFSRYLEHTLGFTRVDDPATLRAGDLVFTTDAPCCPEYPAHVYVFHGWIDRRRQIARISDNTGHRKPRPLFPRRADLDPFAYALRAPPSHVVTSSQ
jgi:hypothetical protein